VKLSHYSPIPLTHGRLLPKNMLAEGQHAWGMKPSGLWVSVDGDDDWAAWCQSEQFGLETYKFKQRITLRSNSLIGICEPAGRGVLHLDAPIQILRFDEIYASDESRYGGINWAKVMDDYDGIIIAPYQWSLRLDGPFWYYSWDCASGCIWNTEVIENISEPEPVTWINPWTDEQQAADEEGLPRG